eukprot:CAMPEP_0202963484 /NCGR_PEP_ID=MMETSP1396-20130829/7481_1 /ASSEMBLY_ACC=CAM_ASM_000872 /TAXON_ID= /ORGANISM="Pseudokeronopsis sp., Strain Brazil" /LENGTH=68 /DNA_ID=CAMNT_0049684737 /DNA_START=461 /DNA_END=667 /DNA_ORIENTATION=+
MRENNKDISAFIGLQKALKKRRRMLETLKMNDYRDYAKVIEMYGMDDATAVRGDLFHKRFFKCERHKR